MKSFQEYVEAIKKELSGFGFNVHHHQDRKLTAMLEVLTEIRDQLVELNKKSQEPPAK